MNNIEVKRINEGHDLPEIFRVAKRHDRFVIVCLTSGRGVHKIDLYAHSYYAPAAFVLSPGQVSQIKHEGKPEGFIVFFSASVFSNESDFNDLILDTCIFDSETACPVIPLETDTLSRFLAVSELLHAETLLDEPETATVVSSYLRVLITYLNRIKRKKEIDQLKTSDQYYHLFRRFRIAVEKNFRSEHSVNAYAGLLNTHPKVLNRVSRIYGNCSASEVIHDRLLLEARRSLVYEPVTIKELGYDLGFEDPAYFTRFFKKRTGISPKEFRQTSPTLN
jgi:AraC-like DNA-binding protein